MSSPTASSPTSLVNSDESVFQGLCQRIQPRLMVCCENPEMRVWTGCRAYCCDVCGPARVRQNNLGITWAQVHAGRARFVTLTQAPEEWQRRRQKMRNFARSCKSRGYRWECAWSTELGSKTGMIHIHAIQHGSYIPQDELQDMWGARVDIRAIKNPDGQVARYISKEALAVSNYMNKETKEHYQDALALNGNRPTHWTRGYFHGLGIKEAIKAAKAEIGPVEALSWRWATEQEYRDFTGLKMPG